MEAQNNNIWLFLEVLAKRKKFILSLVMISTILSAIIVILLPKWYRATALVMPPKQESKSVINLGEGVTGLDLVSISTSADVFVKILKSRTLTDPIIDRFNLKEEYGTETYVETYDALMAHANIEKTEEDLLLIEFEAKDPQRAAAITNAFVDDLDSLSRKVVADKAKGKVKFFEARLKKVNEDLNSSQKKLEEFQLKNKAIDFDEQSRLAIEQAIELKVALSKTEVDILISDFSSNSLETKKLRKQKELIEQQLTALEQGKAGSSFFTLPLASIPPLKNQYNKIYTKVRVGEEISSLLLQQLEQAKIQASGSFQEFSVLQRAQVPELKSRPKRRLIVTVVFVLSLLISIVSAAIMEYFEKLKVKSEADYNRAMMFLNEYFGWLPGIKKNKE